MDNAIDHLMPVNGEKSKNSFARQKSNPFAKFMNGELSVSTTSKHSKPDLAINGKKFIRSVADGQFITRSLSKKGFQIDAHCFQEKKDKSA